MHIGLGFYSRLRIILPTLNLDPVFDPEMSVGYRMENNR